MTLELDRDPVVPTGGPPAIGRGNAVAGRARRFLRGRPEDPNWVRPTLLGLLLLTGVLYLWDLSASGWANSFYAAAVQAGTKSWEALFYGSSDAANSITVDKPPASLWVMGLSARLFGLNSWSLLVPQALMGVGSVGLLYLSVRRWYGAAAGLLAGAALALTPVAVLMFKFDNPDALLVLLLIAAVYVMQRAIESGSTRAVALVGVLIGFGFLTKMMQALLIVPGLALVYLFAGQGTLVRRFRQLLIGFAAMIASAGWFVAIVELVPAADRPYIGGSQHNSLLELVLGYNGFGRLSGNETGSVVGGGGRGGPGGGSSMWGATGWGRMFNAENGGQVSWLIPAALLLGAVALLSTWRAARTDRARAGLLLWGSWLLTTMAVFSFMAGIYHPYYTVALAPAVAAVAAIGAVSAWKRRRQRPILAVALLLTVWWSTDLLGRSTGWQTWLAPTLWVVGAVAAVALVLPSLMPRRLAFVAPVAALAVALGGPAAYAVQTASTGHAGSIPSAGPTVQGGRGGPGGVGGPGGPGGFGGRGGFVQTRRGTGATGFGGGAFGGGLLDGSTPDAALTNLLKSGAKGYAWVAAAVGSNSASGYQLASGDPVMPIGGFNGSDPSPSLVQFQEYVTEGKIHFFLGGGNGLGGNQMGGSQAASGIASWVESNFSSSTVGGVTVYDLTAPGSTA
jgi:4-amino-4-deoxy-L-arabinose transferase-like glycosyltransferase